MFFHRCGQILRLTISCAVAVWIVLHNARGVGINSPLTAFCASCAALGIVVFNSPNVYWALPKPLMPIRAWEASGTAYRLLGVSICGALIRCRPFRFTNTSVYVGKHRGDLVKTHASILKAETAHYWAFIFTLPLICYEMARQFWPGLAWLMLFNALFHVYPALHLRKVRACLEPLMARRESAMQQRERTRQRAGSSGLHPPF